MSDIHFITISLNKIEPLSCKEAIWNWMWNFVSSLYKNGNILSTPEFFSTEKGFILHNVVPDKNALNDHNIGTNALLAKRKLQEMGITICYNIMAQYVSDSAISALEQNIESVKFLVLYPLTDISDYEAQLVLRTNEGRYLPTYVLNNNEDPYINERLHFWKKDYAAITTLWFSSYKHLEPIIAKQLSKLDSDISIEGVKISKSIGNILKKNVFYPLAELKHGNKYVRHNYLQCPCCSKHWKLHKTFLHIFDFKCDHCFLLGYVLEN
jgi:predicted  nucleic acid-binding Zn ribbon protein